jgi:hypothetical protein
MVTKTKLDRMDKQVTAFLAGYLARAPLLLQEMLQLWSAFRDLGLPGSHFVAELTNGKVESFAQRVWEMMLGRHLHLQGVLISGSTWAAGQYGSRQPHRCRSACPRNGLTPIISGLALSP